jgi:glycine betaine/proline transport system substrate-binding protein
MARATWQTGWVQAEVFKGLLEELGYTVRDPETLENIPFYFFSAQGDVDLWANGWFPLHDRYLGFQQVTGKVEPVGFQVKQGALQGYLIDKATADELGITNLGDLQDPEIAAVFDQDGDGKADLIGCNVGWGCERVIDHHLTEYQLDNTVTQVKGGYEELVAGAVDRFRSGESVLFYAWTPHWTTSELALGEDVVWLSVPFSTLPENPSADTIVDSVSGCLEMPCDLGFGLNDIRVVANVEFLAENPAAARLLEIVELPLKDISNQNLLMFQGENTEEDLRRHAQTWIEENRELVDQWLAAARAAAQ